MNNRAQPFRFSRFLDVLVRMMATIRTVVAMKYRPDIVAGSR
jgi:hypothetical protein